MNIYQEKLLDHYNNPKNFGELVAPDVAIELENVSCGDSIKMQLIVKEGIIEDIKFSGEGCAVAIGSASMLTEYVKGKKLKELANFTLDDLIDLLGIELTISRIKCASLSLETLNKCVEQCTKGTLDRNNIS